MNENDDTTVLAFAYLRDGANLPQSIDEAFKSIPRAPLTVFIGKYLQEHPCVESAPLLRRIAELNQGRLEDLSVPAFISYLIAKCGSDEVQIRNVINALRAYDSVLNAASAEYDDELLIAARTEDNGQAIVTMDDLREQLKKRVK